MFHIHEGLYTVIFIHFYMRRDYVKELDAALKEGKKPIELLTMVLGFLNFTHLEVKMYNLLQQTPLTTKQIEKKLGISERTVRKYTKILYKKGFIVRRVVEGERLKYVYEAIPIKRAWMKVKGEIEKILDEVTNVLEAAV